MSFDIDSQIQISLKQLAGKQASLSESAFSCL